MLINFYQPKGIISFYGLNENLYWFLFKKIHPKTLKKIKVVRRLIRKENSKI